MEESTKKNRITNQHLINIGMGLVAFLVFWAFKSFIELIINLVSGFGDFIDKFSTPFIISLLITFVMVIILASDIDKVKGDLSVKLTIMGLFLFAIIFSITFSIVLTYHYNNETTFSDTQENTITKSIFEKMDIEYEESKKPLLEKTIVPKQDKDSFRIDFIKEHNLVRLEYRGQHYLFHIDQIKEERIEIEQWISNNSN